MAKISVNLPVDILEAKITDAKIVSTSGNNAPELQLTLLRDGLQFSFTMLASYCYIILENGERRHFIVRPHAIYELKGRKEVLVALLMEDKPNEI